MKPKSVAVFAPATIANLGSGFDVIGIAIDAPGDIVRAKRRREQGLRFHLRGRTAELPSAAPDNVAAHVAQLMLDEFKPSFGVQLTLDKRMPIGSGLGSSAASSVAAAVACNAILPKPLGRTELLRFAAEGERKATGTPHADNAAPSLYGGACLVRSYRPLDVLRIPVRNRIVWVVVHPHLIVRTEDARRILPRAVTLETAVIQCSNISGLTVGLTKGDAALVGKCVEDAIVEPVRGNIIPGYFDVKEAAMRAGAAGCSISGSGPSLFAVAPSMSSGQRIGKAMSNTFLRNAGVKCDVYISHINMHGAILWPSRQST